MRRFFRKPKGKTEPKGKAKPKVKPAPAAEAEEPAVDESTLPRRAPRKPAEASKPKLDDVVVEPPDSGAARRFPMVPSMSTSPSDFGVVTNLVSREIIDPSGPLDPQSPTVQLLRATVNAIANGDDISAYVDKLRRITSNQAEKSDLIVAQLNQIDDERIPGLVEIQDLTERVIRRACRRGDISTGEAMAAWRMVNQELSTLRASKDKQREKIVDGNSAIHKLDAASQQASSVTAVKWEYTTPQGRELIRKRLWEMKKEIIVNSAVATEEKPAEQVKAA